MTHFGIICPAGNGHLNPMTALGRELQRRGHRVTLIGIVDTKANAIAAGLDFLAIAESEQPEGKRAQAFAQLGELSGLAALRYTISKLQQITALFLQSAPMIAESGIEALLVDQTRLEGETIAEYIGIPFVTVCNALVINQDDSVPPFFTAWSYSPTRWARYRVGNYLICRITKPMQQVIAEYRQKWKLPQYSSPNDFYSKLAIISQQPACFEFPRTDLPSWFHFTGPLFDSTARQPVSFPFEKLNKQPLIYASMGTIQNRLIGVFQKIASACEELDAQLVITLGGSASPESVPELPGKPLVVKYAPQLELLKKSILTITHAGLNTTLESLSNGVPIVAIPITNDQPGVAARIAWTGAGEFVPLSGLNVPRLRTAIQQVLTQDSYKQNALKLQQAIQKAGGVSRAADIIEQAISTGKPVVRSI